MCDIKLGFALFLRLNLIKFMFSPLEQFDAVVLLVLKFFRFDVSLTSILLPLIIANFLLIVVIKFYFKGHEVDTWVLTAYFGEFIRFCFRYFGTTSWL